MEEFIYKLVENKNELEGAFEVRRQVFTQEQGIPEDLEFDNCDDEAMHIVVKNGDRVIGTTRLRFLAPKETKLERMAILNTFRHMGIGKKFISFLIEELESRHIERVVLHAQYSVTKFYEKCGFNVSGQHFWEAGIKHIKMERKLQSKST